MARQPISVWTTLVAVIALSLPLAGCGGSSGGLVVPSFVSGSVNGSGLNMEQGTLAVTIVQPVPAKTEGMLAAALDVTGELRIFGQPGPVPLSGSFDDSTFELSLAGGGYSFTGQLFVGAIAGSYTGPNGDGEFDAIADDVVIMLGEWEFDNDFTSTCFGAAPDDGYDGWIRVRVDDHKLLGDVYFPVSSGPECVTIELTGELSGNTYTQRINTPFQYQACSWFTTVVLTLNFGDTTADGTIVTTAELISGDGDCADCEQTETLTATKCNRCFPDVTCLF